MVAKTHKKYKGTLPPQRSDVTKFKIITKAVVDNEQWYTVQVNGDIQRWIFTQPSNWWHHHIDHNWYTVAKTFDMNEKLYVLMGVRWA